MDQKTFIFLEPTEKQLEKMNTLREAAGLYASALERDLPDGPDKTYALRKLREVSMWAIVAVTRHPDGSQRTDDEGSGHA